MVNSPLSEADAGNYTIRLYDYQYTNVPREMIEFQITIVSNSCKTATITVAP